MPGYQPKEAEITAAFMAARGMGKILDDDVLVAILVGAREASDGVTVPRDMRDYALRHGYGR